MNVTSGASRVHAQRQLTRRLVGHVPWSQARVQRQIRALGTVVLAVEHVRVAQRQTTHGAVVHGLGGRDGVRGVTFHRERHPYRVARCAVRLADSAHDPRRVVFDAHRDAHHVCDQLVELASCELLARMAYRGRDAARGLRRI